MKSRVVLTLLLILGTCFALLTFLPEQRKPKAEGKSPLARVQSLQKHEDPPGTINGLQHPELISDRAAYTVLFLVLADRNTSEEMAKVRAYLSRFDPTLSETDTLGLVSAANEYHQRVSVFDREAKIIKDRHWPTPEPAVFVRLRELQAKKDALVDAMALSLQSRVSPYAMNTLTKKVLPHIKSMTKLAPEPRGLPH